MNLQQSKTLWISLGLAVFSMFLLYSYTQEKKAEYDKQFGATKRVVVAAKDIVELSMIDDTMLQTIEMPKDYIQPGAIDAPDLAVGKIAGSPMKKGEQLLANKLLKPGPNSGLAYQVSPNKRAVTIPVDDVRGVSKLIRPGDRIDIITALEVGSGPTSRVEVKTLLQDVPVLAVGSNVTNNIPGVLEVSKNSNALQIKNLIGDLTFSTVTIEATPQESQDIIFILAKSPGSIYLTLRNPQDRSRNTIDRSSTQSLLNIADSPEFSRRPASVDIPPPVTTPRVPQRQPTRRAPKRDGSFVEVR
ncbi:MAG: Flp pilus assembly protein CpaB [Bdellovibrionales bacterium CG10_big_fil_rev_8_21_14_0_10_45_34]|nr:MAG: Flp pilus assembly protein CpaB [Bdellovibrionales bacterium CG10_big_fil_rev_8_21_14_0_10_45_34]